MRYSALSLLLLLPFVDAVVTRTWDEAYTLANNAVSQMTLDEKLGIVIGTGQLNSNRRCVGDTTPVPRLGIPSFCMNDGPAGMRLTKGVTGFPTGINAASTFSRRLMEARGKALGEEFRGKGVHVHLGPAVDIMRNPKMGRAWESFGPDPYLNGEGAYHTILGIQSTGVQACLKHLIANNQEHWRYGLTANVDDRTLREIYWYPFERGIEADVASVMCAYNRFNETSSCQNAGLLREEGLLRKGGFRGYVVSDWGATHDGAAVNANNGLEMEQPGDWIAIGGGVFSGNRLRNAVQSGQVRPERLDAMVARVLAPWYKLGQDEGYPEVNFDSQRPDGSGPRNLGVSVRSAEHTALVREIAAASAVLLKNNRTLAGGGEGGGPGQTSIRGLPVDFSKMRSIAVVGQDAKMPKLDCNDLNECNEGTMSVGWGSGSNSLEFIVPPIDAITTHVRQNGAQGAAIQSSLSNDLNEGERVARGKDVAFVFVNAMSGELGFYSIVVGNMGDRNDLNLWWRGGSLVERVAAVCNNTIVVVHSVGPVYIPWNTHPNVTGIIYAGAPGEQTGPSVVDVLSGAYNPSGRLPFSIANDEVAYGTEIVYNSMGFPRIEYKEGLFLDYRYMDERGVKPRWPFGFGLSYTQFAYSALAISSVSPRPDPRVNPRAEAVRLRFEVQNVGQWDGTEISQVYIGYPEGSGEPRRVLRGFEEVRGVRKGEKRAVEVVLNARDLSIWDVVAQAWIIPSGRFKVWIGASIEDVRLSGEF
ncbi:hypothetical protein AX16_007220 [Volvariella volvacea WC 439]|nr:hypothetical protein AX16_007220 [Volvariella volvacea WC 439]